jgi:3-dehydroshikimate dehydratase
MIISACSDEISQDLAIALHVLEREEVHHVDLRGVWGSNVVNMTQEQGSRAREMLRERGFQVTALSTAVGKTRITEDFAPELARFERAVELARFFDAPYLRVFSFIATEEEARHFWPEAIERLHMLCEIAALYDIQVAHENEEGGFCAWRPEECLAMHQALPPHFRALFEPCSFTVMNYDPYTDALPLLRPYLGYVHVRDTPRGTTRYTVVGEGDVGWQTILADLYAHNFEGYLTLEPHLGWGAASMTDDMRITSFQRAVGALRAHLAAL